MSRYKQIQRWTYNIIEPAQEGVILSKIFDFFILSLIILNIISVIFETIPTFRNSYAIFFNRFELVSIIIFTIEYILRVWTCTVSDKYSGHIFGRLKYMFTPMAIIDLLAITPFYFSLTTTDLRIIRVLRLFRIFRLAKMGRYTAGVSLLKKVIFDKKEEIGLTLIIMFFMLIISSSIMYHVEHESQPGGFKSIPDAMWWGVCTLTTVGYGDLYPVTPIGKIIAAFMSILGIGMFALPAGILASGFEKAISENKNEHEKKFCPYCGRNLKS